MGVDRVSNNMGYDAFEECGVLASTCPARFACIASHIIRCFCSRVGTTSPRPHGQMFIISAMIVIMALYSLTGLLSIYSTGQEKAREEGVIIEKILSVVVREYKSIAGLAVTKDNATIIQYLTNFSALVRNTRDARVLYVFAYSNTSAQKFSVTTGNYVKDRINVSLNASDSTPNYSLLLEDKTNATVEFTRTSNVMINITMTYVDSSGSHGETFALNASSQNSLALFIDVALEEDGAFVRSKDIYNRSW